MSDSTTKSHLAIALERWLLSPVGLQANDITTLQSTDSKFLENRLQHAFLNGAEEQEKITKAMISDFLAKLSELLLGYQEGREHELLAAAEELSALRLITNTADELLESKKEIFKAAVSLRDLLQNSEE